MDGKWGQIYLRSDQSPIQCVTTHLTQDCRLGAVPTAGLRSQEPICDATIRKFHKVAPQGLQRITHKKAPGLSTWGFLSVSGAPGGIRTHDPCLRRAVLYPAELRMLVRATSYPCRPWASMLVFGARPVGKGPKSGAGGNGVGTWRERADLKVLANAPFSFFFSNRLLPCTPIDPRIRLRFQTLCLPCAFIFLACWG